MRSRFSVPRAGGIRQWIKEAICKQEFSAQVSARVGRQGTVRRKEQKRV